MCKVIKVSATQYTPEKVCPSVRCACGSIPAWPNPVCHVALWFAAAAALVVLLVFERFVVSFFVTSVAAGQFVSSCVSFYACSADRFLRAAFRKALKWSFVQLSKDKSSDRKGPSDWLITYHVWNNP